MSPTPTTVAARFFCWTTAISLFCLARSIPTSECCFSATIFGRCGDGTPATPCCGYGPCQPGFPPCCGCDGGCRSKSLPFGCSSLLEPVSSECRLYFRHDKNPDELSYLVGDCDELASAKLFEGSGNVTEGHEPSMTLFVDLGEEERRVVTAVEVLPADLEFRVLKGKVDPQTNETAWGLESLKVYKSGHGPARLDSGRLPGRYYMVDVGPPSKSGSESYSVKFFGCAAEEDEDENPGADVNEAIHRRATMSGSFIITITLAAILGQIGWRCCGRRLYRQWRLGGLSSMRLRLQGSAVSQETVELPLLPDGRAPLPNADRVTDPGVEYRLEPDPGR